MPRNYRGRSFDHIFGNLVEDIMLDPEYETSPRGMRVKELIVPTIELFNPRARLLANTARDADYGFGVGEFLWYWNGRQDLESMLYYNRRMDRFSDDGKTLNSAYGHRLRRMDNWLELNVGITQWDACKRTLLEDRDSRRAVMVIARAEDFIRAATATDPAKDVPCTLSLQFFIRDGMLYLHTHMRSNDAVWGLTYDLFSFTLLQEMMLLELRAAGMTELELGHYIHTAGSLHIYERHFKMALAAKEEYLSEGYRSAEPMEPLSHLDISRLAAQEQALRLGKVAQLDESGFGGGARWMAGQLNQHRRKRDAERGRDLGSGDSDRPA